MVIIVVCGVSAVVYVVDIQNEKNMFCPVNDEIQ